MYGAAGQVWSTVVSKRAIYLKQKGIYWRERGIFGVPMGVSIGLTLMLRGSLLWMRGCSCSCSRGRMLGGSRSATRTSCVTVTCCGSATHSPARTSSLRGSAGTRRGHRDIRGVGERGDMGTPQWGRQGDTTGPLRGGDTHRVQGQWRLPESPT